MSIYTKISKKLNWQTASDKIPYKSYVAELAQHLTSQTSGVLIPGREYLINTLIAGDDFTGTGYVADGFAFTATATPPPVWTNGTEAIDMIESAPKAFVIQNNTNIIFNFGYTGTLGWYYVTTNRPVFTAPTDQKVSINITNDTIAGAHLLNCTTFTVSPDTFLIATTGDGTLKNDILGTLQNVIEIKLYN